MIFKTSRYQKLCDNTENKRLPPRAIKTVDGLLEHTVAGGQRLDQIAAYYYNDPSAWWRILDANPDIRSAADFCMGDYAGQTIVIPGIDPNKLKG
nr:hypothetical protein [uncultured Desulfobacter sp.]